MQSEPISKVDATSGLKHQCVYQDAATMERAEKSSIQFTSDQLCRRGRHILLRCTTILLLVAIVIFPTSVHCESLDSLPQSSSAIYSNLSSNTVTNILYKEEVIVEDGFFSSAEFGHIDKSNIEEKNDESTDNKGGIIQDKYYDYRKEQASLFKSTNESNWYNWYENHISQNSNEISQNLNFTHVLKILQDLDNSRESRMYKPHMMSHEDYPTSRQDDEVPINTQPASLWDYFSSFMYKEEPQEAQDLPQDLPQEEQDQANERVVVNKPSVINPCDHLQGNFDYWKLNARPLSVTVVGGGIAGLASLKTLIRLGFKDAMLLEAQHRLGGGVNTVRHERWVVEEGPSKIRGGGKNPMYLIAKELEEVMDNPPNHKWEKVAVDNDGNVLTEGAVLKGFKVIDTILSEVKSGGLLSYVGQAVGKFYVTRFKTLWGNVIDENLMHAWIYYLHQLICGRDGLSGWFKASARDASTFEHMEPDYYWKTGADQAVHYLLRGVPSESVRLSTPVCKIFWDINVNDNNEVLVVTADGSSYRSGALVLTISASVLKEKHRMMFIPSLPKETIDSFESVESGVSNKLFLAWTSPWWGSDKPLDLHVFWKDFNFPKEMDWVMSITRVTSMPQRPNMVEMVVTGDASITMEDLTPEKIIGHLVYFLKRVSKRADIPLPEFFHRSQWNSNPWTRGSYGSYVTIDGEQKRGIRNRRSLAPKIKNSQGRQSLFFAGEHTSNDRFGTMDGAMMSGVRAAHWVVQEDKQRRELAEQRRVIQSQRQKITIQNTPTFYKEAVNYYDFFKDPETFLEERHGSDMMQGQMSKYIEKSNIEQRDESNNSKKLLRQRKKQEKQRQRDQSSHQDSVDVKKPSLQISGPVISRSPPPSVFVDNSSTEDQSSSSLSKGEDSKGNRKKQGKRKKKRKNKKESIISDTETNVQLTIPISRLIPGLFNVNAQNSEETEDITSTTSISTTSGSKILITQPTKEPTTTVSTTLITLPTQEPTTPTAVPQHPPNQLTPRPIDTSGSHVAPIPNHENYPHHPTRPIAPKPVQYQYPSFKPHLQEQTKRSAIPQHPQNHLTPRPIDTSGSHVTSIPNRVNYPHHPTRPITPKLVQHQAPTFKPQLKYTSHPNPPINHHPHRQQTHQSHNQNSTNINVQPSKQNNGAPYFNSQVSQTRGQSHVHSPQNIEIQDQFRPIHQPQHFPTNVNNNPGFMNTNNHSGVQSPQRFPINLNNNPGFMNTNNPSGVRSPVHQAQRFPTNLYNNPGVMNTNIPSDVQSTMHQVQHFPKYVNNNPGVMDTNKPSGIPSKNQNTHNIHHQYNVHSLSNPSGQTQHTPQSSPVNLYSHKNPKPLHNYQLSLASKPHSHIQLNRGQELVPQKQIHISPEYQGSLNTKRVKIQDDPGFTNQQSINHYPSTHYPPRIQVSETSIRNTEFVNRPYQTNSSPHLINTGSMVPNIPQPQAQTSLTIVDSHENKKDSQEIELSKKSNKQSSPRKRKKNNRKNNKNKNQQVPTTKGQTTIKSVDSHEKQRYSQEIDQSYDTHEQSSNRNRRKNKRKNNQNKNQPISSSLESLAIRRKTKNSGSLGKTKIGNTVITNISNRRKNKNKNNINNKRSNNEDISQEFITNVPNGSENGPEIRNNNNRRRIKHQNRNRRKHNKQDQGSNENKRYQQSNKSQSSTEQQSTIDSKKTLSKDKTSSTVEDDSQTFVSTSSVKHLMLPQVIHITGPVYSNYGVPTHLQILNETSVNTSNGPLNPLIKTYDNSTENYIPSNSTAVPLNDIDKVQKPLQTFTELEQKFITTLTKRTRPLNFNLNDKELLKLLTVKRTLKIDDVNESSGDVQQSSINNTQQFHHTSTQQFHHISINDGDINNENDYPKDKISNEAYKSQSDIRKPPQSVSIKDDYHYNQTDRNPEYEYVKSQSPFLLVENNPSNINTAIFIENYQQNKEILGGSEIQNIKPQYQTPDSFTYLSEQNISNEPEQPADSPT